MTSRLTALLLALLVSGSAHAAAGSLNPVLDDPWTLRLGADFLDARGTFSSTIDGDPTDDLSTDDLGVDDGNVTPYFGARWRFTDRWRLMFNYFGMKSEGKVREDFNRLIFGDIDISGFLEVKTDFATDFYVAQLGYSLFKNDRAELGIGGGLHVVDFDIALTVRAGINNRQGTLESDSSDLTVPLPNILGFGTYAFTPKLSVEGSIGWFGLNYDQYSGNLVAANAALEYRVTEHVGLGLGYNYVDMNLDIEQSRRTDSYDLRYNGPVLYVSAGF
jgi:hypothetical protein